MKIDILTKLWLGFLGIATFFAIVTGNTTGIIFGF